MNDREIIEKLLNLEDEEIRLFYNHWDKSDCSLVEIYSKYLKGFIND